MYLSTKGWITICIVLVVAGQHLDALDDYANFYYHVMQFDKGSPPFIIDALWNGVNHLSKYDEDSACFDDVNDYQQAVSNKEEWALKMFDSSTHLHSGFLEGNVIDYGNTDECVKVRFTNESKDFKGRICQVVFKTQQEELPMVMEKFRISFAVCVPSSCDKEQVERIMRHGVPFRILLYVDNCLTEENFSPPYDDQARYIITFFIGLLTVVLISTAYDVSKNKFCHKNDEENKDSTLLIPPAKKEVTKFEGVLLSFSLYRNGKALLEEDTNPDSIKALHGLRFMSACGVACIHRHLIDPQPFTNMFIMDEEIKKWYRLIVFNGYIWVDVFFLVSGLLISYNFILKSEHKKRLNLWKFYLHRYIRLTPTLIAVILISLLTDHMCNGPHCEFFIWLFKKRCERYWWTSLLYINNIYDQFNMCLIQSWYLAADMQLYFIAPVLLYTLIRWPRFIFIELNLLLLANAIYVFIISYKFGLIAAFYGTNDFFEKDSRYIYNQSYARAGPWLIGFALGIILQRHNKESIRLSKFSVALGWIIGVSFCISAFFGIAPFIQDDYERKPIFDSLFKALYRDIWALGISWIILACYTGYGGWVNKLLSSYVFHPISKLTYSFYLIHIFGQFLQFQNAYVPRRYSDITQFSIVTGDIVIGIILAIVLHLTVEAPGLRLERVLWNTKKASNNILKERKLSMQGIPDDLELGLKDHTKLKRIDSIEGPDVIVYDKTITEKSAYGRSSAIRSKQ